MNKDGEKKLKNNSFKLTQTHIELIRQLHTNLSIQSPYFPLHIEINPKRPFGNSDIDGDIRETIESVTKRKNVTDAEIMKVMCELPTAFAVMMKNRTFDEGTYHIEHTDMIVLKTNRNTALLLPAVQEATKKIERMSDNEVLDETDRRSIRFVLNSIMQSAYHDDPYASAIIYLDTLIGTVETIVLKDCLLQIRKIFEKHGLKTQDRKD